MTWLYQIGYGGVGFSEDRIPKAMKNHPGFLIIIELLHKLFVIAHNLIEILALPLSNQPGALSA